MQLVLKKVRFWADFFLWGNVIIIQDDSVKQSGLFCFLKRVKSVEDAKNEMLYNDNINATNSTIKREQTYGMKSNSGTNGWNPNGGSLSTIMYFYGSNDLSSPTFFSYFAREWYVSTSGNIYSNSVVGAYGVRMANPYIVETEQQIYI